MGRVQAITATMDNRPRLSLAAVIATWILPAFSVVILLIGGVWFLRDSAGFTAHAHGRAAAAMFLALTVIYALIGAFSVFWLVQTRDLWHRDWYADDTPVPTGSDPRHSYSDRVENV